MDDLQAIKGIGPKKLAKMRRYLTVNKPAAQPAKNVPPKKSDAKPPTAPANSGASEAEEPQL